MRLRAIHTKCPCYHIVVTVLSSTLQHTSLSSLMVFSSRHLEPNKNRRRSLPLRHSCMRLGWCIPHKRRTHMTRRRWLCGVVVASRGIGATCARRAVTATNTTCINSARCLHNRHCNQPSSRNRRRWSLSRRSCTRLVGATLTGGAVTATNTACILISQQCLHNRHCNQPSNKNRRRWSLSSRSCKPWHRSTCASELTVVDGRCRVVVASRCIGATCARRAVTATNTRPSTSAVPPQSPTPSAVKQEPSSMVAVAS